MKHILVVAGSDSCSGAGLQADIKTISSLGSYALTAVTAVTAQNRQGVAAIQFIEPALLAAQLEALAGDFWIDAVKIGMLGSAGAVEVLADFLTGLKNRQVSIPIILDPVLVSGSGQMLGDDRSWLAMRNQLLPLITVFTPNLDEAERLLDWSIENRSIMKKACFDLLCMGPDWVVLKGGHLPGGKAVDILGHGKRYWSFAGPKIEGFEFHGTGCAFSSALAVYLAGKNTVPQAVALAKEYVLGAIKEGLKLEQGLRAGTPPNRLLLDHYHDNNPIKERRGN